MLFISAFPHGQQVAHPTKESLFSFRYRPQSGSRARKVTADRECFEKVVPVTAAFLKWLESESISTDTDEMVEAVRSWADKIVENGMNPELWGMAKTLAMQAKSEGVDLTDDEAMQAFVTDYNRRLSDKNLRADTDYVDLTPTLPIVEHSPKIGRNQPCTCGSG